jgi:hypothetical protein
MARIKDLTEASPESLVDAGGHKLAERMAYIYFDMYTDAMEAGFRAPLFGLVSGYRSQRRQDLLFRRAVQKYGNIKEARKWVAKVSPHRTGFAIDLNLGYPNNSENVQKIEATEAYKFMRDVLAPKYNLSPYSREPWHWECDKACRADVTETELSSAGLGSNKVGWLKRLGVVFSVVSGLYLGKKLIDNIHEKKG